MRLILFGSELQLAEADRCTESFLSLPIWWEENRSFPSDVKLHKAQCLVLRAYACVCVHTTHFLNKLYEQMCIYVLQRETNILLSF